MGNPLLEKKSLPAFSLIKPEHIVPAIEEILADNKKQIDALTTRLNEPSWENFIEPLDNLNDRLAQSWSPVSHMNAVVNGDALREVYNQCLTKLSEYSTELGHNIALYKLYEQLKNSSLFASLNVPQQTVIDHALRDFKLSGIALNEKDKTTFGELQKRLAELTSKFAENVLDATQGWTKQIESIEELSGVPDTALAVFRRAAEDKNLTGYLITLEMPSYLPIMTYADSRALRKEIYEAYVTRASDLGPMAGKWDNTQLMKDILALRQQLARLLGMENYAERSLVTKMAQTPQQVIEFLEDLGNKSRPAAEKDFAELKLFATDKLAIDDLQAWDLPYVSEKLKQEKYNISQEELRPYFPVDRVIAGMFLIVGRLFNIAVEEIAEFDSWHPDVKIYRLMRDGKTIAKFYLDLFARANKRGGAWMDTCRVRRLVDGEVQLPVAYLVCNFTSPVGDKPSLLTHNEVITLFHEFGHGLHHMLTRVDYADVSGINGVAWDAVELPSQFMENFCWQKEALDIISSHFETGAALPQAMLEKMLAAKNFQSSLQMVRQLEFALLDFHLHIHYSEEQNTDIQQVIDNVRKQVAVVVPPAFNRFQHSFSHIFAGGYAAGYYSYKWAEVLSADAFSLFEERGVFDAATGERFLHEVLEKGGSEDPMTLFTKFRGRAPSVDALLRHSGIVG